MNLILQKSQKTPELHSFLIKRGEESRFKKWLVELQDRSEECGETMDREKSILEAVYTRRSHSRLYVYWLIIRKQGGDSIFDSPCQIDIEHLQMLRECIEGGAQALPARLFLERERSKKSHHRRDLDQDRSRLTIPDSLLFIYNFRHRPFGEIFQRGKKPSSTLKSQNQENLKD